MKLGTICTGHIPGPAAERDRVEVDSLIVWRAVPLLPALLPGTVLHRKILDLGTPPGLQRGLYNV